jgi:signal transduction histidine kinase
LIQKLGLERSLVSLIEKTQNNSELICSIDVKCSLDLLSLEEQTQIYRIFQECINNTLKHADASALKISIKKQLSNLVITYQDNGRGIDENIKVKEGIGMMTIRERANTIKGKITIGNSSKNKGLKLILTIPLNI